MADKILDTEIDTGKQVQHVAMTQVAGRTKLPMDLDATTEALRHAAEDTPSGALPEDVETVPVFDRAGLAPKI